MILVGDVFDRSGPTRLVVGGAWFLILMILAGVFWWLWSVVVSRVYGPIGYGIFNTAASLHNFAWVFIFGGLFQGLMKYGSEYVAKSGWKLGSYFSTGLKYLTAIGIVMFILLSMFASNIEDPIMKIMVLTIAVSFLFTGTKDALASIIGSFQKSDHLSIVNSSRAIVTLVGGLVLVAVGAPSYMLPVLLAVGTACQLGLCIYFLRFRLRKLIPFNVAALFRNSVLWSFGEAREFGKILAFGFFVSLGAISFNVMKSLDIIVLKMFFDYSGVGVYSVADTTSSILFFMTSFSLPVIPAIAEAHAKKDRKLLEEYVKVAVKYPLLIGLPLTLVILTMAEPFVLGIYGPAFAEAVVPLQILIIGTFMLMLGYNLSSILVGVGKPKLSGALMIVAAVQYIVSLFILAPPLGFVGAALALTITGVTSMLLVPYYLKKVLKVSVYSGLHKVLLSATAMALVLFIVPKSNPFFILFGIIGGVAAFLSLLRLMGYLTSEDFEMMRTAGGTFKRTFRPRRKR